MTAKGTGLFGEGWGYSQGGCARCGEQVKVRNED